MLKPQICKVTDDASVETLIQQAATILKEGKVIVCATDTGYLLGVDGLNPTAIRKIYEIKGRSFDKPIHLVVSDQMMAKTLADLDETAEQLFQRWLPGPLTLILKKKSIVPDSLVGGLNSIGIRQPNNPLLLRLVQMAGCPITATSANRSGAATPYTVEQVLSQLNGACDQVDLIIDQGQTLYTCPSTIVDMTTRPAQILRQGPIQNPFEKKIG